jgi:FkbM family methyltransferase
MTAFARGGWAAAAIVALLAVGCRRHPPARREIPTSVDPEWLRERYGESLYSQDDEEILIRAFFRDRRDGVFLDVGAGDPVDNSTTYYLEKHLGWRGIAVDAIGEYAERYARQRPATRFFAYFVADKSGAARDFFVADDRRYSSASASDPRGGSYRKREIATIALNDLLRSQQVNHVDFLSMDIEGAEPLALAGFDIERYRPELACIEIHSPEHGRAIVEYFTLHGYREIVAYRKLDDVNRYFTRQ